jgi:tyrosyl-tRNA synthetase
MPLLEGLDGVQKMSKSLGNYVGINDAPNEQFGKIMSISDDLMWKYWELATDVSMKDIAAMKSRHPKEVKEDLAATIITQYHGAAAASAAATTFEVCSARRNCRQTSRRKNCH